MGQPSLALYSYNAMATEDEIDQTHTFSALFVSDVLAVERISDQLTTVLSTFLSVLGSVSFTNQDKPLSPPGKMVGILYICFQL